MADEALEGAGLTRDYTTANYACFAAALTAKSASLGGDWTPETVGRALWARAVVSNNDTAEVPVIKKAEISVKQTQTGKRKR